MNSESKAKQKINSQKINSQKINRVRGFPDRLPTESFPLDALLATVSKVLRRFDFEKVDLPIVEHRKLFSRVLGTESDIVNKEMYSFLPEASGGDFSSSSQKKAKSLSGASSASPLKADPLIKTKNLKEQEKQSNSEDLTKTANLDQNLHSSLKADPLTTATEPLTLRPEGTAGAVRLFISQNFLKGAMVKWYYQGPMFRKERPQRGRFRQFNQVGAELFGDPSQEASAEILSLSWALMRELSLDQKVHLEINSLGSLEERQQYKTELKNFLSPFKEELSIESQHRLHLNPLRIWDSKSTKDQEILQQAPLLKDSLQELSLQKYEKLKSLLNLLNIPFKENPGLVRGLDYYNDLVFEWIGEGLGAQSTVLAGGRYDSLIERLGGPSTPAVGWALGLERLSLLCSHKEKKPLQLGLLAYGETAKSKGFQLAHQLRLEGFELFFRFSGNFSKQMKRIGQKCRFALILGEKELQREEIILKNLEDGTQCPLPLSDLSLCLKKELQMDIGCGKVFKGGGYKA